MPRWLGLGVVAMAMAALLGACGGEGEGATPAATGAATVAGTAAPAATPSPAPRGLGKLAFERDGDIWALDLDSGQEHQLTDDGGSVRPSWSADGGWLLFYKKPTGAPWVVRQDGSGAWVVDAEEVQLATWSPGGHRLAYVTQDGALSVVDADGGERVELLPGGHEFDGAAWSPDGKRLAAWGRIEGGLSDAAQDGALWVVDVDGRNPVQLLPPGDEPARVAWSPDGKRLAIERWIRAKELTPPPIPTVDQGIWLMNADGSGLTKLYGPYRQHFDGKVGEYGGPVEHLRGWSPDGKGITFWQAPLVCNSCWFDGMPLLALPTEGGDPRELASWAFLSSELVAWSAQGDRLAIVEGAGRYMWVNKQIVVMRPDGSDRRVLSDPGRADLFPAWSPDGKRIAFVGMEEAKETAPERHPTVLRTRRIWSMNSDGSDKRQLTDDPAYADQFPQWSGDGSHILFVRQPADAIEQGREEPIPVEIWLMKADGSEQRAVGTGPSTVWFGYYGYTDWSQILDWRR